MGQFKSDRSIYRLVDLTDLPFPHNLFGCGLDEVMRRERRKLETRRRIRGMVGLASDRTDNAGWRRIQEGVVEGRLPTCDRHDLTSSVEWDELAIVAAELQEELNPWTEDDVRAEVLRRFGPDHQVPFARVPASLFIQPIRWDGVSDTVNNGQHRLCGARVAGARRIMVAVGP